MRAIGTMMNWMNRAITARPVRLTLLKRSASGKASANDAVIPKASIGTPNWFLFDNRIGRTLRSDSAVHSRGAPNDAATLMPNIDTSAPRTITVRNVSSPIAAASCTVSCDVAILSAPRNMATTTAST